MNMLFSSNSLIDVLETAAAEFPNQIAFTYLSSGDVEGKKIQITYQELSIKAKTIAAALQELTAPGDRVLIILDSNLDFIATFFACLYAKVIAIPAYPPVTPEFANKLQHMIADAEPKLAVSNNQILKKINKLHYVKWATKFKLLNLFGYKDKLNYLARLSAWDFAKLNWLNTDDIDSKKFRKWEKPVVNGDDLAFLQYTSGSTNNPKGVMVTHANLLHNVKALAKHAEAEFFTNMQCASWLPLYHDMGLIYGVIFPIYLRTPCVLMSPFSFLEKPLRWLQVISHYKITHSGAPNFAYELCVNRTTKTERTTLDLSSWQLAFTGAEPIRTTTLEKFSQTFAANQFNAKALWPCYGLAESTLFVSGSLLQNGPGLLDVATETYQQQNIAISNNDDVTATRLISCGTKAIDTDIKIVDPETRTILSDLTVGEIWVRSPSVTKGYWNKPAETNSCFNVYTDDNQGPYLRTGDLGFLHHDQLFISGRHKDIIIINGRNYYPQDIELAAERCHESIRVGCSIAFAASIHDESRLVMLVEVKKNFPSSDTDKILDAIKLSIIQNNGLRVYAICLLAPHTLAKTTSGKLRRNAMRQLYETNELSVLTHWQQDDNHVLLTKADSSQTNANQHKNIKTNIELTIRDILDLPSTYKIAKNVNFIDLGMDSLMLANFTQKIKQRLVIVDDISLEEITKYPTVHSLSAYLDQHLSDRQVNVDMQNIKTASLQSVDSNKLKEWNSFETLPGYINLQNTFSQFKNAGATSLFFNCTESVSNNRIMINNICYINYSGYNYLGMSGDPIVVEATLQAVKQYGTSVSASRVVSGEKPLNKQLEAAIASLIGTEDALVFTAGHATNISVITHLFSDNDLIVHDSLIHNSSLQGAIFSKATRIPFPHNDFRALDTILQQKRNHHERVLILTEGAFSMDGDIPPLPEFIAIKKKYHAFLMVDEAHSIGVLGKNGGGICEHFNLDPTDVDIWMGTLSKAFGSCGGYVAGSGNLINYLKFSCGGFVFSAGITPANSAAALESIRVLNSQPQRVQLLQTRSDQLLSQLKNAGINTGMSSGTPIIPVIVGDEVRALKLSTLLREQKIYALPIVYPAVDKGHARVRFFVNCQHSEEEINYTANTIITGLKTIISA